MTLKEYLAMDFAKDSPEEGYQRLLRLVKLELTEDGASKLFAKAQRLGKYITIVYRPGIICGGDIELCDEMPG